jgi:dienelactone hydrolase
MHDEHMSELRTPVAQPVAIDLSLDGEGLTLNGDLSLPERASGIVVFAHGSGSSRLSPRNRQVAERLQRGGLGTLLFDLLTEREEAVDLHTRELRFDIAMLAARLVAVTDWIDVSIAGGQRLRVGYFGASTGAGAALVATAQRTDRVGAVVSRGGRPDLAGDALPLVRTPTLLIVGSRDVPVIRLNEQAMERMSCAKRLEIVPGATHLFEEPGALDAVANLALAWFRRYLDPHVKPSVG